MKQILAPVFVVISCLVGALGGVQIATGVGLVSVSSSCVSPEGSAVMAESSEATTAAVGALEQQRTAGEITAEEYANRLSEILAMHSNKMQEQILLGTQEAIQAWGTGIGTQSTGTSLVGAMVLFAISEYRRKKDLVAVKKELAPEKTLAPTP